MPMFEMEDCTGYFPAKLRLEKQGDGLVEMKIFDGQIGWNEEEGEYATFVLTRENKDEFIQHLEEMFKDP